jgi:hypothetical protein
VDRRPLGCHAAPFPPAVPCDASHGRPDGRATDVAAFRPAATLAVVTMDVRTD